ncbi:MAG: HlyD family secretion protein [Flavobacteriales bacterium]|nr:HlyD family secretion protein [Flavobacteriales bacterium]
MKAFKLREEKSFIKVLKEPPSKKKKVNKHRLIYLGLGGLALFFILRKVFLAAFLISAEGLLDLPKQTINFADDIEIKNLFIDEGDNVSAGDTLFQYRIIPDANMVSSMSATNQLPEWLIKDISDTKRKKSLCQISLAKVKKELSILNKEASLVQEMLIHGVNEEYEHSITLEKSINMKMSEMLGLENEIQLYSKLLAELNHAKRTYRNSRKAKFATYNLDKYYICQKAGIISDIFYEEGEICYKKEELMTLHMEEGISVQTFFDQDEISFVKEGDLVEVTFPDGSDSMGVIDKLLISTYALPSEFQKKYEPTERNVVAQVRPVIKSDEQTWSNFYKMDVKVKKWRYK